MPGDRETWTAKYAADASIAAPTPFVAAALAALAPAPGARALDVACGRGRHALAAARRGFRVEAVDWALPALRTLTAAACADGLDVSGVVADVGVWTVPADRYDLVLVVDFLERDLVPALRAAVRPGGRLLMETFLRGQERYGHPRNPAYLLAPGELAALVEGWTTERSYEGRVGGDDAPAMRAGIVARRPSR